MTEEEKRLKASQENRRDLEAELKEERDRFDAQNQEAYDKEVSGENFLKDRAQEDEEEIDGGKLAQSIAFEASVGLATDLATTKLLALPPLYALANFVSGATANLIAQKIRGETKLSIGEILASGGVGIIPGTTIKTGKQLSKVVGKAGTVKRAAIATGLAGVGSEAVRIGIDEKRLLNVQEALTAGTLGGVSGASLQKIVNASPAVLNKFNDMIDDAGGALTRAMISPDSLVAQGGSPMIPPPRGFQQLGAFYKKGDLGKQLLRSNRPVVNMTKRDGVVKLDPATITEVEKIIDDLEAFHDKGLAGQIPKWKLDRPTSQYRGKRRVAYTKPDGTPGQLYLNWSASKQTYVARDVDKLIKAKMNRAVWNVPQSGKKGAVQSVYKTSKAANAALNQKLLNLFDDDPELMQKIIGDTKQIVYVEHIHPGRSPYWNKTRAFGPGDPENLLVIEDTIFPKVKTAIEKQLYDSGRYKNIYADMDAAGDILLKDATTDKLIGRIPGITNQSQVKAGIYRALTGKQPMDLVDIDPTLRPYLAKLHGFDTEDFGRLKDVQAGIPSKAQDKFEEIKRKLESKEVQLEASKTGIGKKLSVIKEQALEREIKALRKEIEQLRLFDTSGEGTGLRTQKQKIKIAKPKRVKKSKGETEESVQIPIEYQGPKYIK